MSEASGVTVASLASGLMRGLLGPGGPFVSLAADPDGSLDELITQAEKDVENELSTRLTVTSFAGYMGTDAPAAQAAGAELEGPYDWPPANPGDWFPRFKTRVRPVQALTAFNIILPGGIQTQIQLPLDWFRMDHLQGELMVSPSLTSAPLQAAGLMGPLMLGLADRQIPKSVLIGYTAGMSAADWAKYPKVKRLVALRAAILILPQLSLLEDPLGLTSQSADGLSESHSSGFIFKDMEERLQAEADKCKEALLDLWDGIQFMVM